MKLVTVLLALLANVGLTAAADWPRFRGPNGSGISDATTVPTQWTDTDYNWNVPLPGVGHASPVVVGERIYITCGDTESAERHVVCLNTADGKIRWQRTYPSTTYFQHHDNNYATSTPAADSAGLVVTWTTPDQVVLMALDPDGAEVWRLDLGNFNGVWGSGTSPIIVDDLVVLMNDQMDPKVMKRYVPKNAPLTDPGESFLIAVDRATGETRWKTKRKTVIADYATPCVRPGNGGGRELVFSSTGHGLTGVDLQTGEVNWEIDDIFPGRTVVSPVLAGDMVIASYGNGLDGDRFVAIQPGAKGEKPSLVYDITRSVPLIPTPLYKDGLAYLWCDDGVVTCIQAATGKVVWRKRVGGSFYGSPVWVDGRLYCIDKSGDVVVITAGESYEMLSRVSLGEPSFATPAVADGVMYLRTESRLMSLGGR